MTTGNMLRSIFAIALLAIIGTHADNDRRGPKPSTIQQVSDSFASLPVSSAFRKNWPTIDGGVTGNLARHIVLPDAMGMDSSRSDTSWKYFAATFTTTDGQLYDFFSALTRQTSPASPTGELAICMFKLGTAGVPAAKKMTVNAGFGFSQVLGDPFSAVVSPVTTDYYMNVKMQNCIYLDQPQFGPLARKRVDIDFTYQLPAAGGGLRGAPVGNMGAQYKFRAYDATNNVTVELILQDQRGTVFEGSSGNVATLMSDLAATGNGIGSLEYANPRLAIVSGYIASSAGTKAVKAGNLWLDHQEVVADITQVPIPGAPLYTGNWLAMWLDDQRSFVGATFFPAGSPLLSGTKTANKPTRSFGEIIHPVKDLDQGFKRNGVTKLFGDQDFAINLLDINNLDLSTVFTSPFTGKRYATRYELEIFKGDGEKFYFKYFNLDNEIYSTIDPNGSFYEGGITIYSDKAMTKKVGFGFFEQMGRNAL